MEIILHVHHANISMSMRQRAERAVRKLADRLKRTVDAVIRFEEDGAERRVELELRAPKRRPLVAEGRGKFFGGAFSQAIARLEREVRAEHDKNVSSRRALRKAAAA
ncbi:MAG: HPF/RaiA family ribosome-associated protein [Gemmatimonadaceae bacterium]|nr:HPF/RaiA family ribosome-associated protein [Gemmatimonadaceae bacterium]